jgi:predicted NBD/HSP70 family sugar kinase
MHWGVDLGGTKISAACMRDLRDPSSAWTSERPTPQSDGFEAIVVAIRDLVWTSAAEWGLDRPKVIGIGTPGPRDPRTGLMKNSNTTCLNGRDLLSSLEEALQARVFMANDANCFALSQARFGAGRGHRLVFGVILGTGVGGGIVIDGKAWSGGQGLGGEWGHNSFDPDGIECYCGRRGCLETLASGTALERLYHRITGERRSLKLIIDERSEATWIVQNHAVRWLGLALGHVVNLLDPDVIVLGGGASNMPILADRLAHEVSKHTFNPDGSLGTPILSAEHTDRAGVFGAAILPLEGC